MFYPTTRVTLVCTCYALSSDYLPLITPSFRFDLISFPLVLHKSYILFVWLDLKKKNCL